jgi:hypothetical protein
MDYRQAYHELEQALEQQDEEHEKQLHAKDSQNARLQAELQKAKQRIEALKYDLQQEKRKTPTATPKMLKAKTPTPQQIDMSGFYTDEDMEKVKNAAMAVIQEREEEIGFLRNFVTQLSESDQLCKALQSKMEQNVKQVSTMYHDLQDECQNRPSNVGSAQRRKTPVNLAEQLKNEELMEEVKKLKLQKLEQEQMKEAFINSYRNYVRDTQKAVQPGHMSWLETLRQKFKGGNKHNRRHTRRRNRRHM